MIFFMINPPSYLCHHQRFLLLTHTSYEGGSEFFNRFLPGIGMGSRLFVWIHLSQDRFFGGVFFTMNMKTRETGMLPYDCQTICNQPGCFNILVFMILLLPDQYQISFLDTGIFHRIAFCSKQVALIISKDCRWKTDIHLYLGFR